MEVLLEYRGSRRQITVSGGESITNCVTTELRRIGRAGANVYTADHNLQNTEERDVYLLQKWSPQWDCYVDIRNTNEIHDGDRLTVVPKPKPPSKIFSFLCCCCSSDEGREASARKRGISKNEEIQALDYTFGVESETHSHISDWETKSVTPTQDKADDDMHYVRDDSGRASWKMVPKTSQGDDEQEGDDETPQEQAADSDVVGVTDVEPQEIDSHVEDAEQSGEPQEEDQPALEKESGEGEPGESVVADDDGESVVAGDDGEPGESVVAGDDGEPGDAVVTGDADEPGDDGVTGEPGESGEPGDDGVTGEPGDDGVTGEPGESGEPGEADEPGDDDVTGEPGEAGEPGDDGVTGEPGGDGVTGEPSEPGEAGKPEEDGESGDPVEVQPEDDVQENENVPKDVREERDDEGVAEGDDNSTPQPNDNEPDQSHDDQSVAPPTEQDTSDRQLDGDESDTVNVTE